MIIYALHGFLGRPSDWQFEKNITVDLFNQEPIVPFEPWADRFNAVAYKQSNGRKRILLGYSLGGRLALHALINKPNAWSGAIIVSAHLGLDDAEAQKRRYEQDLEWAKRFETEKWEKLMTSWNNQKVFQGDSFAFNRQEDDFSREKLSQALRLWSLGLQKNLKKCVEELEIPLLFVAGENDERIKKQYTSLLLKHLHSKVLIVPNAGHRVPWQCPCVFHDAVCQYMELI